MQIRLRDAVKKMSLRQYTPHNAFNDAYSTAEILTKLKADARKSFAFKETIKVDGELFVNKKHASKEDALQGVKKCRITCSCGYQAIPDLVTVLSNNKAITALPCICGK